MTDATCTNCGVPISETPENDGFHPVQTIIEVEDEGAFCKACAPVGDDDDQEYKHTGDMVAAAARVDLDDADLARALAENMSAEDLRRFMSAYDLTRSRGARKLESSRQAVAQDRVLVASYLDDTVGLVDKPAQFSTMCSCGYEEHFASAETAKEAASEHKSENPQHFPKAWSDDGARLYG